MAVYGRDVMEQDFVNQNGRPAILSVPHLTFIDAFGLYRNMYRSLTGELHGQIVSP
jgi:hypothetical protein